MTKLEEIKNGASVSGVVPNQSVEVVSVDWIGDQALMRHYPRKLTRWPPNMIGSFEWKLLSAVWSRCS